MEILSDQEIDQIAYEKGIRAAKKYLQYSDFGKHKNPYKSLSDSWVSWNVGWNNTIITNTQFRTEQLRKS